MAAALTVKPVRILAGQALIEGDLVIPARPAGLVVFATDGGSGRFNRRHRIVAQRLEDGGFATLSMDLLTPDEEDIDRRTAEYRFDIPRLGHRVAAALDWAAEEPALAALPVGCFGASAGAAAVLTAAAERPDRVRAIVCRSGRPDLAADALSLVTAPTLLIVGGHDEVVVELNRTALRRIHGPVQLEIVTGASGLFGEPGTLEHAAELAVQWCRRHVVAAV